jgi:hypothetical protein
MRMGSLAIFSSIGLELLAGGRVANAARSTTPNAGASVGSLDAPETADEPGRYSHIPKDSSPRFQLGLGTGFTWGLGDVWTSRGDVIENSGVPVFWELSVAPSYLVARDFALGIRAALGLQPGTRGEISASGGSVALDRKLWHASATGRYQPEPGSGWYVTLSAGAAAIVDSRGDESVSQWAPLLGAAAGYDLRIARPLSLGFELRAARADFGEGSHTSLAGYHDYHVSTWIGAALVGNVLP